MCMLVPGDGLCGKDKSMYHRPIQSLWPHTRGTSWYTLEVQSAGQSGAID